MIKNCITDDEACREAARQEIIRRITPHVGQVQGRTEQAEVDRLKMIVQKAGLGPEVSPRNRRSPEARGGNGGSRPGH